MQSVNFYLDEFKPPVVVFPLYQAVILSVVLVVSGIGLVIYQYQQWRVAEQGYKATYEQQLALEIEVNELNETLPKQDKNPLYALQLTQSQQQLAVKRQILSMLQADKARFASGFSAILEALARQISSALWLDKIILAQDKVQLEGYLTDSPALFAFLQRLGGEAGLQGLPLRAVNVAQIKHFDRAMRFSVSSATALEQ